jgi:hypothetical protein
LYSTASFPSWFYRGARVSGSAAEYTGALGSVYELMWGLARDFLETSVPLLNLIRALGICLVSGILVFNCGVLACDLSILFLEGG